jgi:hypothetical protein
MILILRKNSFLTTTWYVIKFYLGFLFFIPKMIYLIYKLIKAIFGYVAQILKIPAKIEAKLVITLLSLLAIWIIFSNENIYLLYISMFVIGLELLVAWHSIYSWTTNPLVFFDILIKITVKGWNWLNNYMKRKNKYSLKEDEEIEEKTKMLRSIYAALRYFKIEFIDQYTDKDIKVNLIKKFLVLFLFIIILTSAGFSLEYFALYKIDNNNIIGIGSNYTEFLYFSILTFVNMDFNQVIFNVSIANIISIIQVFSTLYILTIVILIFTSITEEAAKSKMKEYRVKITEIETEISDIVKNHYNIKFEVDNKELSSVEEDYDDIKDLVIIKDID